MHKGILKTGIFFCIMSVVLGAFATHGLKDRLSNSSLIIFETGIRYQFYHSFALLITAMLYKEYQNYYIIHSARFFIAGIILFSGSLYLLAMLLPAFTFVGIVTPLGGISFIMGWFMLFRAIRKKVN